MFSYASLLALFTIFALFAGPLNAAPIPADSKKGNQKDLGDDINNVIGMITNGIATFFTQNGNAGACGTVHKDNAQIVALPTARYNNGEHCGKTVEILNRVNGIKAYATVADECPTCKNKNCLDLSLGAFAAIGGKQETGVYDIAWKFAEDNSSSSSSSSSSKGSSSKND